MSTTMRHPGWLLCLALAFGCERRIDEPEPRPPVTQAEAPARPAMAPPEPAGPPPAPPRCIEPTADEPKRPTPRSGPDPRCPDDPGRPELPWGEVIFAEADTRLKVEVASQDRERQRGLMFRRELPETEGMLFVFERSRMNTFWMKNTCLPLDMLFIDGDGLIVGIEENVPTMNTNSYSVRCPSRYVLEVNAGWSRRHGVEAGQRVRFEGVE